MSARSVRAAYITAREATERAKHSFTERAKQMHAARRKFILRPTRANRAAYKKAKAIRASRLRTYRRRRSERNRLKAEYLAAKKLAAAPLRMRALDQARQLVGVMEQGGNNAGAKVSEIIRANGGSGPEPWCGDFVAYCYRRAGSKAVDRRWASVRLLGYVTGVRRTRSPLPGDLVRFNFDHVGVFVRRVNDSTIETIEGNTGASGAVSDSATGGDGVYIKRRNIGLVADYLHVHK